MDDWRTGGDLDRVRAEAAADYADVVDDLRAEARQDALDELTPEERATLHRPRRAWQRPSVPVSSSDFLPLAGDDDAPF